MNAKGANARAVAADLRRSADKTEINCQSQKPGFNRKGRKGREVREKALKHRGTEEAEEFEGYLDPSFTVKAPFIQDDSLKHGEFAPRCLC